MKSCPSTETLGKVDGFEISFIGAGWQDEDSRKILGFWNLPDCNFLK
jgi:hypothetical protein